MERINKKKEAFSERKLTQAEIAKNVVDRERQAAKEKDEHREVFYQDNPNRALEDYEVAGTVEEALQILNTEEEKHPEKRFKAAFEAYCSKREPALKVEFPKLKRSQRLNMMHKEF